VHYAEGMLETCVHSTLINVIRPWQLAYPAEPLKSGLRNDLTLPIAQLDKTIDLASYLDLWAH